MTHHLYDPGFLSRSLLLGYDVLGQNNAAEQGTDAGAGRGSDLHHGRPVHDGRSTVAPPINRRPESRPALCQQAPSYWCRHAAKDLMLHESSHSVAVLFLGGQHQSWLNSKAENAIILSTNYTFTVK